MRYEERGFDRFHLLPAYYSFFKRNFANESIVFPYFEDI